MEIPAYTLIVPCLTSLGRRPTVVATFFLTAICSFIVVYTPTGSYQIFQLCLKMNVLTKRVLHYLLCRLSSLPCSRINGWEAVYNELLCSTLSFGG